MSCFRSISVVALVVVASATMAGCTSVRASTEPSAAGRTAAGAGVADSAPILFAYTCRDGNRDRTESYTTYAAVWADERSDCTATRTTGTRMSEQQSDAVRASRGAATLDELAAACAVRGAGPWVGGVDDDRAADLATGLLTYCPGHPESDRLREAVAAFRG